MEGLSLKLEFLLRVRERNEIHWPRYHIAYAVNKYDTTQCSPTVSFPEENTPSKAYPSACRRTIQRRTRPVTAQSPHRHTVFLGQSQLMLAQQFLYAQEAFKKEGVVNLQQVFK